MQIGVQPIRILVLFLLLELFFLPLNGSAFPRVLFQGKEASLLSESEVQEIFNEFLKNQELALNFPEAGCWERTYEMSWILLQKGILPLKSLMNSEGASGALIRVDHPLKKGQFLLWNNHVAPVVLVQKDRRMIPFTLDPSLFSKAVPTAEWAQRLRLHSLKGQIQLTIVPVAQGSLSGGTLLNYQNPEERRINLSELRMYRELGEDPAKAAEWFFQRENEELKAGGAYYGF